MMIIVAATLLVLSLAGPPPSPIYDSYGPNQLYKKEGKGIKTTNGNEAMYGVSPNQCAGVCDWMGSAGPPAGYSLYTKSFVGKGPNQVAKFEGNTVKTSNGFDGHTGMSVKDCAELCLEYTCDGFAYNPNQNGGKCYLKNNSSNGIYKTVYNSDGWTFYWLEENFDKCFCTCKTQFVCVTCKKDGTCDAY